VKWIALTLVLLVVSAGAASARAEAAVYRAAPAADVSLPFWCDWGYDWDERCYRDLSDRLPIGGDEDKVWRSALRFPLSAIPGGAIVDSATLSLWFDGVCLGPRKTEQPCPARTFTIDVHPVLSRNWFREREVDFGPLAEQASLWTGAPGPLAFDVTNLVVDWVERGAPNHGLLLKLAVGEEQFGVSGPKLPSSEFVDAALHPVLDVTYLPQRARAVARGHTAETATAGSQSISTPYPSQTATSQAAPDTTAAIPTGSHLMPTPCGSPAARSHGRSRARSPAYGRRRSTHGRRARSLRQSAGT
jgi:hypothetical protein